MIRPNNPEFRIEWTRFIFGVDYFGFSTGIRGLQFYFGPCRFAFYF